MLFARPDEIFPEFLDRVREDYDSIIIDAPPLLAVADPAIIGALKTHTGTLNSGLLLIAGYSSGDCRSAYNALEVAAQLAAEGTKHIDKAVATEAVQGHIHRLAGRIMRIDGDR